MLKACLDLLNPHTQQFPESAYEIIVTDDSTENESEIITTKNSFFIRWTNGPKKGPAANRNNGARIAKGDWLLFIDDDCLPTINILSEYAKAIALHKGILVFEGSVSADREQKSLVEECPLNETGGYMWSCNFMINKNLFLNSMNGFDENFPYAAMEDVDMHYRLKKNGIQIVFLQHARVIHPWRLQNNLHSITLKRFKSTLYFINKHPEKRSEINSVFYLRAFYHTITKNTLKNAARYHFHGFFKKLKYDFLQLYFALYMCLLKR